MPLIELLVWEYRALRAIVTAPCREAAGAAIRLGQMQSGVIISARRRLASSPTRPFLNRVHILECFLAVLTAAGCVLVATAICRAVVAQQHVWQLPATDASGGHDLAGDNSLISRSGVGMQ